MIPICLLQQFQKFEGKMNILKHAELEFRAMGWVDDLGFFADDIQENICDQLMQLLTIFAKQGHSGATAPYLLNLFDKLANHKPLSPLTGEDWEWTELDYGCEPKFQNKRASNVFKNADGSAYDIDGKVGWEWHSSPTIDNGEPYNAYFTCSDSHVPVTFPYTPTTIYEERLAKIDSMEYTMQ